jgi:hypothetical protein
MLAICRNGTCPGVSTLLPSWKVARQKTVSSLSPAAREAARVYGRALSKTFKAQAEAFRAWGAEGGKTRARNLSRAERQAIARKAARARWGSKRRRS